MNLPSESSQASQSANTPVVTELTVVPVAGHDSMLLNLSGAHGPFFTRKTKPASWKDYFFPESYALPGS